ncbi:MAG TPA: glycosyltransferase [Chitinophagaceae bacterium]|nr:glycosyltransferase [Chitinophagaceae bacterium]
MKIVHVVEPFASGIAVFVRSLTETMPNDFHLVIHGERKEVMPASEVKKMFPAGNVRFVRWRSANRSLNPVRDIRAFRELLVLLKRLKKKELVDVVHLHSSKSGFLGRLACRIAGIDNVIYTPNGASFLSGRNRFMRRFYQQLERLGHSLGGQVVCCSESELGAYRSIGIEATYINNGIAISQAPAFGAARKTGNRFRVVTSGRIVKQKDPGLFNEVAAYFAEFDRFEFTWIGDGEDRHLLTSPNIRVTGWLSEDAVRGLLEECDVYISTSQYEGLSFSVLEALSHYKPVLLSDCIGNRDVVKQGINGDLFRNKDQAVSRILKYYNNLEMLKVMGDYSRKICEKEFDVTSNFSSYRELYVPGWKRVGTDQGLAGI